jgi:hypothetical protein
MDPKDEEAQEQEEETEKKADTYAPLPFLQTRLLLFVQRWFLYGKRTTVG